MGRVGKRKSWRWIILSLLVCWAITSCQSFSSNTESPEAGVIVRSAYGSLGELFQTEIINLGLEALGYQVVDGMELDYQVLHQAVAQGYLEYTASHWSVLHTPFFTPDQDKLERLGTLLDNSDQGYLINTPTADTAPTAQTLGITNLEQFRKPQIARQFDIDGNGKADLIGCDDGWRCHAIIEHHLDEYGLRDTVEHRFGEYDDLMKNVVMKRLEQAQPVLYYSWTPHWINGAFRPGVDVQWLEVPYTSLPGDHNLTAAETTVDGKNLGFATDQVRILANRRFLAEHPDVAAFFQVVQIPVQDISLQNRLLIETGESSLADIRHHAEMWVENHRSQFRRWLRTARRASPPVPPQE